MLRMIPAIGEAFNFINCPINYRPDIVVDKFLWSSLTSIHIKATLAIAVSEVAQPLFWKVLSSQTT